MQNELGLDDIFMDLKENFTEHGSIDLKEIAKNFEPIGKETNLTFFDGSWNYVDVLPYIGKVLGSRSKWTGTFFIKMLQHQIHDESSLGLTMERQIDKTYTLPNQNVSLQNIVQLYATMDPGFLSSNHSNYQILKETLPEEFVSCFDTVIDKSKDKTSMGFYDEIRLVVTNDSNVLLHCEKDQFVSECEKYCNWHERFFKDGRNEEFLTMMKYSLPQPRVKFDSHPKQEQAMAKRLFGASNVGNLSHQIAPNAMPIFCFNRMDGYIGEDVGMSTKVCNEYRLMPSDKGLSISNNKVSLKRILQFGKPYEAIFDPNVDSSKETKIKRGTYWSQQTYVINTAKSIIYEKIVAKGESNGFEYVKIQFHQSEELAQYRKESHFDKSLIPLDLRAGYEYTIDITPIGQVSSEEFEAQSMKNRNCFLKTEGLEDSIFKLYSENNCKYECHVKIAREACKCQPWDYFAKGMERWRECDVFGRKCFIQEMETLASSPWNNCPNCKKACKFLKYQREIIEVEAIRSEELYMPGWPYSGKYYMLYMGQSFGSSKAIANYVEDTDAIFYDLALNSTIYKPDVVRNLINIYESLIFVHLRYMEPKINEITPKYTVGDMIGNFGGQFGLFEQVTGASFLGLLNLLILLFKLMFSPFRRE